MTLEKLKDFFHNELRKMSFEERRDYALEINRKDKVLIAAGLYRFFLKLGGGIKLTQNELKEVEAFLTKFGRDHAVRQTGRTTNTICYGFKLARRGHDVVYRTSHDYYCFGLIEKHVDLSGFLRVNKNLFINKESGGRFYLSSTHNPNTRGVDIARHFYMGEFSIVLTDHYLHEESERKFKEYFLSEKEK